MARLSFYLANRQGAWLADIPRRVSSSVEVGLNALRQAGVRLSLEEDAAGLVYPHATVIKAFLDGEIIASTPILSPQFDLTSGYVDVAAICPSWYLTRRFIGDRPDGVKLEGHVTPITNEGWTRVAALAEGQILWRLANYARPSASELALGIPSYGIERGTITAGVARDREYPKGKQLLEAQKQLTEIIGGQDFEYRPVEESGALVRLDTFTDQGTNRTADVMFAFNTDEMNCSGMTWDPAGDEVTNRYVMVGAAEEGAPVPEKIADSPSAQVGLGIIGGHEARADVSNLTEITSQAQERVSTSAWPTDYIEVIPAQGDGSGYRRTPDGGLEQVSTRDGAAVRGFGRAPQFGPNVGGKHQCYLGDTVSYIGRNGQAEIAGEGRLIGGKWTELPNGAVVTSLTIAPTVTAVDYT